jgi:hypothetical protein
MFTVIVSPVTDAIGKAVPAAGSVALGYVLVTLLPSVSQVNDNEFVDKIDNLLDMDNIRNEWSKKSLERFEQGKWKNAIIPFNNMIDDTIKNLPMLKNDTDTYEKVVDFIHRKKSVTKSEILNMLNWGVRISFSGYRNRLRNEPTIRFTKNRYEVI